MTENKINYLNLNAKTDLSCFKPIIVNPKTYQSNGKLLLTGEYVVLDGALSLAVPTKFGQSMHVENIDQPKIIWKSLVARLVRSLLILSNEVGIGSCKTLEI